MDDFSISAIVRPGSTPKEKVLRVTTKSDMPDPHLVAERLIAIRAYHDVQQGDFADSVDIDRSSYSKIENAKKVLNPHSPSKSLISLS